MNATKEKHNNINNNTKDERTIAQVSVRSVWLERKTQNAKRKIQWQISCNTAKMLQMIFIDWQDVSCDAAAMRQLLSALTDVIGFVVSLLSVNECIRCCIAGNMVVLLRLYFYGFSVTTLMVWQQVFHGNFHIFFYMELSIGICGKCTDFARLRKTCSSH